ncbi:MAG: hypothetical protein ACE5JG_13390 [Planctomycetota bacterium]
MEVKFGTDPALAGHLRPVLVRIYGADVESTERNELLRLVVEAYASHLEIRKSIEKLRRRIQLRLTEIYSRVLGIEPPGLGI